VPVDELPVLYIVISLIQLKERPFWANSALFYFRKLCELDISHLHQMQEDNKKIIAERDRSEKIRRQEERNLERQREIEAIFSIFGDYK